MLLQSLPRIPLGIMFRYHKQELLPIFNKQFNSILESLKRCYVGVDFNNSALPLS